MRKTALQTMVELEFQRTPDLRLACQQWNLQYYRSRYLETEEVSAAPRLVDSEAQPSLVEEEALMKALGGQLDRSWLTTRMNQVHQQVAECLAP